MVDRGVVRARQRSAVRLDRDRGARRAFDDQEEVTASIAIGHGRLGHRRRRVGDGQDGGVTHRRQGVEAGLEEHTAGEVRVPQVGQAVVAALQGQEPGVVQEREVVGAGVVAGGDELRGPVAGRQARVDVIDAVGVDQREVLVGFQDDVLLAHLQGEVARVDAAGGLLEARHGLAGEVGQGDGRRPDLRAHAGDDDPRLAQRKRQRVAGP